MMSLERPWRGTSAPDQNLCKALKKCKKSGVTVKACSHITGGGFYENVPRMLKDGVQSCDQKGQLSYLRCSNSMLKKGKIRREMMYQYLNMGSGW